MNAFESDDIQPYDCFILAVLWSEKLLLGLAETWSDPGACELWVHEELLDFCLSDWVFAFYARFCFSITDLTKMSADVWIKWVGCMRASSDTNPLLCAWNSNSLSLVSTWALAIFGLSWFWVYGNDKLSLFRSLQFDVAGASMVSWSLFRSFLGLFSFRPLVPAYKPLDQVPFVGGKATWSCSASRLGVTVASRALSSAGLLIMVALLQGIYSIICICSSAACAVNW